MATPFTAPALDVSAVSHDCARADVELLEVDHAGSSYEGRVFVNNPGADARTERSEANGYVGSFHIFGHGGCLGDPGHCDVRPQRAFDPRPGPPLGRARKVVIGNQALVEALKGSEVTITVVPANVRTGPESGDDDDLVKIGAVRVITYR